MRNSRLICLGAGIKKFISLCFLMAALSTVTLANVEDKIVVARVSNHRFSLEERRKVAVSSSATTIEIKGNELDLVRQEAESLIAFMGRDQVWTDYGPDSSYVSVTILLGGKTYAVHSWYPLYKDKDRVAYVDGSLVYVSSKQEKEERENTNDEKHKALMRFLDKILEGKSV